MNDKNNVTICNRVEITFRIVGLGYNSPRYRQVSSFLLGTALGAFLFVALCKLLLKSTTALNVWIAAILFAIHSIYCIAYMFHSTLETMSIGTLASIPVIITENNIRLLLGNDDEAQAEYPLFDEFGYLIANEENTKEFSFVGYAHRQTLGYIEQFLKTEMAERYGYFRKLDAKIGVFLWLPEQEKGSVREKIQNADIVRG